MVTLPCGSPMRGGGTHVNVCAALWGECGRGVGEVWERCGRGVGCLSTR
jgi:hypothetical protein